MPKIYAVAEICTFKPRTRDLTGIGAGKHRKAKKGDPRDCDRIYAGMKIET
jgi:hypothetical protein